MWKGEKRAKVVRALQFLLFCLSEKHGSWQHFSSHIGRGEKKKHSVVFVKILYATKYEYSPSLWHGFCPVKRTGKYFAKKWSEQKVLGIEVAGLYSTYQKYKRIDGPSSYQFRENWTWVFFPKKLQKSKLFSPKIRGFLWGQTWTVRTSNHPSNHPWKKIGGLLPRILSS